MATKTIVTPKGTARWPKLDTPDTKWKPEGEYSIDLILGAEEAQPLIDQITGLRDEFYKQTLITEKKKVLKKADLTFSKPETDDEGNETGRVILKFKSKASYKDKKSGAMIQKGPVPRFDAKGSPIKEPVGFGSTIKVAFEPNCWYTAALGVGISLRLCGVQVIEMVQGGGHRTAEGMGFGEEEGYVAEKNVEEKQDAPSQVADASGDF